VSLHFDDDNDDDDDDDEPVCLTVDDGAVVDVFGVHDMCQVEIPRA